MKKKIVTFALLALLAVGSIAPMAAKAYDSWDYGLNTSSMVWYNNYYHSDWRHYGTITKSGVTWYGPVAQRGYWSFFNMEVTGPYNVTYDKYILLN